MKKKRLLPKDAVLIPASSKKVFDGVIFDVYQWQQKLFDGSRKLFEMARRPDTVCVLPIIEDSIAIIKEQQPGMPAPYYTEPGGEVEPGEDIETAARRELKEETGLSFKHFKLIDVFQSSKRIEWFLYTLVAYDLVERAAPTTEPGEQIELLELTLEQIRRLEPEKMHSIAIERQILLHPEVKQVQDILNIQAYSE